MPAMKHPNSRQTIEVAPSQVSLYAAAGWRKHVQSRKPRQTTDETQPGEPVATDEG